jgi:hypothetical protein
VALSGLGETFPLTSFDAILAQSGVEKWAEVANRCFVNKLPRAQRIKIQVAALKNKLENAFNEDRILMLCIQVLIGFDYRAVFEDAFSRLSPMMQHLMLASLSLLILALTLMLAPLSFNWIAGKGGDPKQLHRYIQKMIEWGLVAFTFAMCLDLTLASSRVLTLTGSWIVGAAMLILAMFLWFGLEFYKRKEAVMRPKPVSKEEPIELKDRVKQVLVETRIALPGVQATLGFQFIIVLASGFDALPQSLRVLHLASLMCSSVCAIFLIAPAAYHRIVLGGEDTEEFVYFASRMLLIALVPLALALSGDVTVVVWKITRSMPLAITWACAMLTLMLGVWFGYMSWRHKHTRTLQLAPHGVNAGFDNVQSR